MTKLRKPCDNCPWRRDAPREYWDPTHFAEIWRNCQDDGLHVMLCHKANAMPKGTPENEKPICQGWVRVMGFSAIGVRIAAMNGHVTVEEVEDTKSMKLFKTFEAMLRANKVPVGRRNRWTPR